MTRSHSLIPIALVTLAFAALSIHASGPDPKLVAAGDEFQVNTYTTGQQTFPSVAAHDDGFVVIWASEGSFGTDSSSGSIQGRRYESDGTPIGDPFQVNSYTTNLQNRPLVSSWTDGNFVVIWNSANTIRGRVFGSNGVPLFEELEVTDTSGQGNVQVGGDGFLVVWSTDTPPGSMSDTGSTKGLLTNEIYAQRFDSTGSILGLPFQVNTETAGQQKEPDLSLAPDGSFRVVWSSEFSAGPDGDPFDSIQTRSLASDGTPLASDFQVNSYTTGGSFSPSVDFADDGSFVVAFYNYGGSPGDDTVYSSIVARRFDSAGDPIGGDFQVNSYTGGYTYQPEVKVGAEGDFVVVWSGTPQGAAGVNDYAPVVDRFDSNGARIGAEFQASTSNYSSLNGYGNSFAQLPTGDFLVVWQSDIPVGDDDDETSIQGRLFRTEADIAVTKTDGVDTATPGGSVTYAIEVTHSGPDAATNVSLTDVLPAALDCTFTSVASGGATGNTAAGAGDLDETLFLPTGASVTYTLDCDVDPDARGTLVNQAFVTADQLDSNAANNQATDTDSLEPSTDLLLLLTDGDRNVGAGEIATVHVTVTNDGPSSSFGGTVLDVLPAELSFSASSDCTEDMGAVLCSVPALAPGEQASLEYQVLVDVSAPLGMEILVDAVVTTSDEDPNASNDSGSATWTVVEPEIFANGFESGDVTAWSSSVP